jgi:hypothetical protein
LSAPPSSAPPLPGSAPASAPLPPEAALPPEPACPDEPAPLPPEPSLFPPVPELEPPFEFVPASPALAPPLPPLAFGSGAVVSGNSPHEMTAGAQARAKLTSAPEKRPKKGVAPAGVGVPRTRVRIATIFTYREPSGAAQDRGPNVPCGLAA